MLFRFSITIFGYLWKKNILCLLHGSDLDCVQSVGISQRARAHDLRATEQLWTSYYTSIEKAAFDQLGVRQNCEWAVNASTH